MSQRSCSLGQGETLLRDLGALRFGAAQRVVSNKGLWDQSVRQEMKKKKKNSKEKKYATFFHKMNTPVGDRLYYRFPAEICHCFFLKHILVFHSSIQNLSCIPAAAAKLL